MEWLDILTGPKVFLSIVSGVFGVGGAVGVWVERDPGTAALATGPLLLGGLMAIPALRLRGGLAWLWLLASWATVAVGFLVSGDLP